MSDKERAMKFLDNLLPDDVAFDKIQATFNEDGSAVIITISNGSKEETVSDKANVPVPKYPRCTCYHDEYGYGECYGTKEREPCICGGDERKCDFYPLKITGVEFGDG